MFHTSFSCSPLRLSFLLLLFPFITQAAVLKGRITDQGGEPLPFASVYLKGTTKGTTSNADGYYSFELPAGKQLVICQYIGYQKTEIELSILDGENKHNFSLGRNEKNLKEITIKSGENPALEIIRQTIRKRPYYNKQMDAYRAKAYIKGNFKLRDIPEMKGLMGLLGGGSESDKEELEKSKGIIYLSESYNEIAYKRPDKLKITVISSRVSGNSGDYGFSSPMFINLYDNHIELSQQLSPRGMISPIADAAMLSYRYELLSAYIEDGKLINRIKVTPRRKYEPLFSGIIEIIDKEWRLHAVDLGTSKEYQLELIDSLQIKQLFVPVGDVLMVKDQSFYIDANFLGFRIDGKFVNIFTDYEFNYDTKKTFNRYIQEYDKLALSHERSYWDTIRPVPLDQDEIQDFIKKDSIERADKGKKDTVKPAKIKVMDVLTNGIRRTRDSSSWRVSGLLDYRLLSWNTIEGFSYGYRAQINRKLSPDARWLQEARIRYGYSNRQLNGYYQSSLSWGKTNHSKLSLQGGRYVFQYNQAEPVNELLNTAYTLLAGRNYLKMYQAWHVHLDYQYRHVNGLTLNGGLRYQDRQPLGNSNLFSWQRKPAFTENYPTEKLPGYDPRHQALSLSLEGQYQPGRKYIKYPDRIVSEPSAWPTFGARVQVGLPALNSTIDYGQWRVFMHDHMNLNLWGRFSYRLTSGGFFYNHKSYVADYTHFNGGQMILASPYLNSFQLSPYYLNSNTERLYMTVNAEHHFMGLLTNKVPLFRKLKWYLVAASNAYYVNANNNYVEVSAGLENVGFKQFKLFRVDGVVGYTNFSRPVYGIRIGMGGVLSGSVNISL